MLSTEPGKETAPIRGREGPSGRRPLLADTRGVTLIEMVMSIVIIGIVAFVVGDSIIMGMKAYLTADERVEALQKGRYTLERIEREVRNSIQISNATATATTLCFEGITDATVVSFRYSGTQVTREELGGGLPACPGAGGTVLADGITAFAFSYLQNSGVAEATPSALTRRIAASLTSTTGGESMDMRTEIYPRNIW